MWLATVGLASLLSQNTAVAGAGSGGDNGVEDGVKKEYVRCEGRENYCKDISQ